MYTVKRVVNANVVLIVVSALVGYFLMLSMTMVRNSQFEFERGDYRSFVELFDTDFAFVTISTCPYCNQARDFLNESEVDYTELSLDKNPGDKRIFLEYFDASPVPILISKNKMTIGFDRQKWVAFLENTNDHDMN